jgi:hypothetical protein
MREMKHAYNILVGKLEKKRIFGRHRLRWVESIRLDLGKREWKGVD